MSLKVWLPLISDLSNNATDQHTITGNGTIAYDSTKFGTGLKFNGTSTYVQGSVYTTSTMTYMCWIYFDTLRGTHLLDCRTPAGVGYQPMYINPSSGVQCGGSTSGWPYIAYTFATSTWYHIAVTYSPTKCELFINGSYIGESTTGHGTDINAVQPFYIGCRCTQINWYAGRMNDFRIYDHTCSRKEIEEAARGLFLHYKLKATDKVTDCSGYKNHGQITGTLSAMIGPRYSTAVKSAAGATNYIASQAALPSTCQTVCFWANMNFSSNQAIFADKSNYWALFYYTGRDCFLIGTGSGSESQPGFTRTVEANTWHFYTIVRTDTYTKKFYVDGVEQTAISGYSDYYTQNAGLLNIFRRNCSTTPAATNMAMSDFRIYLTQLTDKQIKELYNESAAIDRPGHTFAREFVEV